VAAAADVRNARMRFWVLVLALLLGVTNARAQTGAPPSDAVNSMLGGWEMSNADHDKTCIITFKPDTAGLGRALDLGNDCTATFPNIKDVAAWTIDNDALRLIDARGTTLLEFNEVENGMFESAHSTGTLYFLQTVAAAQGQTHTPDQMFGSWNFVRANKTICQITLMDTAADTDSFALEIKPNCDQFITRFAPRAWRMDRGQFVLLSTKADVVWRFEEEETNNWHRIPEGRQPLLLVKQ
jgi:Protease inhibitor Inh